jgi:hypothetical protein
MKQNLDLVKHGKSEVPVSELFLSRWSPRAFAESPIGTDTLKRYSQQPNGRRHRSTNSPGDL